MSREGEERELGSFSYGLLGIGKFLFVLISGELGWRTIVRTQSRTATAAEKGDGGRLAREGEDFLKESWGFFE